MIRALTALLVAVTRGAHVFDENLRTHRAR